ncbi:FBP1-like protein [Mya arenaria]|uniref:FBP1-like protein n=1 Tax=Mya arenaria TaxID=6604 RepID=A0ABY7DZH0_MYAAR|nr:FBP1-like protein [Mya arenaria]
MDCGLPSMPDNASISGNMFNIGMRVKFTCSEGTSMSTVTTDTAVCQPDGQWSETNFSCNPENIDPCMSTPCGSHGTCVATVDSYWCDCETGWTGPLCEQESIPVIDPCMSTPCGSHGTCVATVDSYWCDCETGWTGPLCEQESIPVIDPCMSTPCGSHGTCVATVDSYWCDCETGWTGPLCEQESIPVIDPCMSTPCGSHGTCVATVDSYWCDCETGWTGPLCEQESIPVIDPCMSTPCGSHGTCVATVDSYWCDCETGWTGPLCEQESIPVTDPCMSTPCGSHGTCVATVDSYWCDCETGWTGPLCEQEENECLSSPCQSDEECVGTQGSFSCTKYCPSGWMYYGGSCYLLEKDKVDKNAAEKCSVVLYWLHDDALLKAESTSYINKCISIEKRKETVYTHDFAYKWSCASWDNGHIFDVNNAAEWEAIKTYFYEQYNSDVDTINGVWMSVQDFDVEGVYKLSDGSPVEFTDWQDGQPDNYADNDDCVNGWIGIQLQWNDINCEARFWFICEYELNP